jgi:flagellar hook-associated protein 1 FlgK
MSLTSALNIGRSGIAANQAALEVAGNNLANVATPGYTRQSSVLRAATPIEISPGNFLGTGVRIESIIRNIDIALEGRLNTATADQSAAETRYELLTQIESIYNDLSDTGLSSRLSEFFNAWSELANNPSDASLKTMVVQQGSTMASYMRSVHQDVVSVRNQLDESIRDEITNADSLLQQIADLNGQISSYEGGSGSANSLRDARDQLIRELSEMVDVSTVIQDSGATDVFLNGTPLVIGAINRGIDVEFTSDNASQMVVNIRVGEDGTYLNPQSGSMGSLIDTREQDVIHAIDTIDTFIGSLIYEVNRVHSQGQGDSLFSTVTGTYTLADTTASLTHADAGLDFVPGHGSFKLHVTQKSTDTRQAYQIDVDLDGIGGPDMSLDDLVNAINAAGANVTASTTVDGRLKIDADSSDYEFSFSDDSSGVLASLGVNTFFTGKDGLDVGVNEALVNQPHLLATTANHAAGGNATALAIAGMQQTELESLGGVSLPELWSRHIEDYAVRTAQADLANQSAVAVVESLSAQRSAVSGVAIDEEAIDLVQFQRAYQGSARFLSVVDELMDTLLALVR